MLCKIGVVRNFAKLTGKHLYHRSFFNKVAKFLRTPFLQNTSGRLLLNIGNGQKPLITFVKKAP